MAGVGLDCHKDFVSLLSLSNQPDHENFPNHSSAHPSPGHSTSTPDLQKTGQNQQFVPSSCSQMNGDLHNTLEMSHFTSLNGFENSLKRGRGQMESLNGLEVINSCEDTKLPAKRQCPEDSYLKTHSLLSSPVFSSKQVSPPTLHLQSTDRAIEMEDQAHSSLTNGHSDHHQSTDRAIEMEDQAHSSLTNGHSDHHSTNTDHLVGENSLVYVGRRKAQFCTGLIEEVMYHSQLTRDDVDALLQCYDMQCSQCLCGEPGHLDHISQKPSLMDTS